MKTFFILIICMILYSCNYTPSDRLEKVKLFDKGEIIYRSSMYAHNQKEFYILQKGGLLTIIKISRWANLVSVDTVEINYWKEYGEDL